MAENQENQFEFGGAFRGRTPEQVAAIKERIAQYREVRRQGAEATKEFMRNLIAEDA